MLSLEGFGIYIKVVEYFIFGKCWLIEDKCVCVVMGDVYLWGWGLFGWLGVF